VRIVVAIKQVPETSSVRMDEATGTMIRDGVEAIVNPLDLYAVECALRLRETVTPPAEVVVVTMGPPRAESALREVLAMGADRAVLVTDKAFAGADTWSTAGVLAATLRRLQPVDLILCGERATDGDTGQVGPGLAAFLDLPVLTYVSRLVLLAGGTCQAERLVENGRELLTADLPAVVTVVKEIAVPRLPTLRGKQRARRAEISVWTPRDLEVPADAVGLKGSPTRVERIFRPRLTRACEVLRAGDAREVDAATDRVLAFLAERGLL
jgi:electron transfer flavoprotein beta subunit